MTVKLSLALNMPLRLLHDNGKAGSEVLKQASSCDPVYTLQHYNRVFFSASEGHMMRFAYLFDSNMPLHVKA